MKFEVGDKVVIQHSNDEGEVIEIINDKMVLVDVRGVRFPAYTDQLDYPYFKRFSQKTPAPPEKKPKKYIDQLPPEKPQPLKKERIAKLADGVWLTFLPVFDNDEFGDDVVESLKIHLVNNTTMGYHFSYRLSYFGKNEFDLDNQIPPFQDFYIHDIPFANLNDNPVFECEFALLTPDKTRADHYETSLKLRAKQVFNRIEEIKKKGEATFSFKLFDSYPFREVVEETPVTINTGIFAGSNFRVYEASRARQHLESARSELDLHIEKLTDKWQSLDNFEILTLQLQTFEKFFDLALAHHLPSMVVIHGVGSGKLRDEIHEILRAKQKVKSFVNRYDPRYGYGATEIFFQY